MLRIKSTKGERGISRLKKIGVDLIVDDLGRGRVRLKKSVHGLLWSELVFLMDEWGKFLEGREGTRFDKWLDKKKKRA